MDVIQIFGEIEWGRGGIYHREDENLKYPPIVVWRYKENDERRDQLIVEAVKTFKGNLQWTITFRDRERLPGRNWSIMPKRLEEFQVEIKKTPGILTKMGVDLAGAFAQKLPEVGKAANKELPDLAKHIKQFVQEGLDSKVLT